MGLITEWRGLTRPQRTALLAAYLGWTLDAFDFFLMVFMVKAVSEAFNAPIKDVSEALFLTLAARPLGALAFGLLAERIGRRPVLVIVVLSFSVLSALSGAAQTLGQLLVIRALFGFAMGGEWGIGASLAMETLPPKARGAASGLIQAGYPSGFLLASLAFFLLFDAIGWRWMFVLGLLPSVIVLFVRLHVEESPAFAARAAGPQPNPLMALVTHWKMAGFLVILMALYCTFSHGTQDLYPTFLQQQRGYGTQVTGAIAIVINLGAIVGALTFGPLSERFGRRRTITTAALLSIPAAPLWVLAPDIGTGSAVLLAAGGFLMQMCVQGAWAIVPAHLNELSPGAVRAMFPGVVYQLGNLVASRVPVWQADYAEAHSGTWGLVLLAAGWGAAGLLAALVWLGPERRGQTLSAT